MPETSCQEIWNNCLNIIRDNVTAQNFKTWFKPIKAVSLNKQILTIQVPSQFFYEWIENNYITLIKKLNDLDSFYFYLLCGSDEDVHANDIIKEVGKNNCESLSQKSISEVKDYIAISNIYIGNDSFGQHIACQMGLPSFVILLDTPRAYSDYSINQKRIIPPNINLDKITHDTQLDPNSITVELVLKNIENFI